jgi:hypothetical protein
VLDRRPRLSHKASTRHRVCRTPARTKPETPDDAITLDAIDATLSLAAVYRDSGR